MVGRPVLKIKAVKGTALEYIVLIFEIIVKIILHSFFGYLQVNQYFSPTRK